MLKIENVRKVFNAGTVNEKVALNGLNLELKEGDFVTVIGGNGAGKSTMLNSVAGVYGVDGGKILIDGEDAGTLFSFEDGDITHHFIRWTVTQITPGVDHYAYRTDRVTVNGVDTPLDRVSYFTTAEPIETLVIGGKTATLKP